MQMPHPVAQGIDDEAADHRMVRVDRIAATGVVGVERAVFLEQVVGGVLQPAPTQHGTVGSAFGCVVVDHVEDDADAGAVQRAHHAAELVYGPGGAAVSAVGGVRCAPRHRTVAPHVGQALGTVLGVEFMNRHQFDRGDTQFAQVVGARGEPGVRAAQCFGDAAAGPGGESPDMQFVDDLAGRHGQGVVPFPVEPVRVDHDRTQGAGDVVARVGGGAAVVDVLADHGPGVGIDQELVTVMEQSRGRVVRAGHAPAVDLAVARPGHAQVPVGPRPVDERVEAVDARRRRRRRGVEQQQFDGRGLFRIHREVDRPGFDGRAQGRGGTWLAAVRS